MKISYNWLKKLINIDQSPEEIAEYLTHCGLEVESIEKFESVKGGLKGMVIGKVVHKEKHPDADRLSLTKVDIGLPETLSIVCGAPNVEAGQKVVIATIGATLYPSEGAPFEIKKSKIRGALSEGMICAEDEIGLGMSHAGIMVLAEDAQIGIEASEYFKIQTDYILEIGLTPNRSDAASHLGIARDLAAVLNCKLNTKAFQTIPLTQIEFAPASGVLETKIQLENPTLCPRYSGVTISGIQVEESPEWLKNSLKAIGLKPINNIVDITNYILHETGQPLHAFDAFTIKDHLIKVRSAVKGEKFTTLDGIERNLSGEELMICDNEKPMCMAGIFGGLHSGVSNSTKAIFLESAYFDPANIRKASKLHSLKTDASFRFERGTDPNMVPYALNRAIELILKIAGGQLSSEIIDIYPKPIEPKKVAFSFVNCNKLIGKEIDRNTIKTILDSLGIKIQTEGSDGLLLEVPPFKTDVTREADVIEEVMRIYGYNEIEEAETISYSFVTKEKNELLKLENKLCQFLASNGYSEIMSTSLTKSSYYSDEESDLVRMLNPLSNDLNVLRKNLIFSGLEAIQYNINRKNQDLKLVEVGRTYQKDENQEFIYTEEKRMTLFETGKIYPENSFGKNQQTSFFSMKNSLEQILKLSAVKNYQMTETNHPDFKYCLEIKDKKTTIGVIGEISKSTLKKFDIEQPVFIADLNLEAILKCSLKNKLIFQPISKFPSVRRDLALLIDQSTSYQQIEKLAFETERKLLKEVSIFDIYQGDKIEKGKKSYAISFQLQDEEATLTDKQIENAMSKLINTFKEKLGAELRS